MACGDGGQATLEAAVEEQRQVMAKHGDRLDMEVLGEMEVLQRNISEALRLFPPLILLMRQVKSAFSVTTQHGQHYVIPKVVPRLILLTASPYLRGGVVLA